MALDYSTENIGMLKTLFEGSCEQAVDCDISLPDYCPDISRVLRCCVAPSIISSKISGDRACADGNALVRIIYDDENKILRGDKTNKVYKIGQKIKVEVIGASKQMRTVDFMLKHETD